MSSVLIAEGGVYPKGREDYVMDDEDEWREYNSLDLDTHPEEATEIEMKFADGRRYNALYSRAAGMYFITGEVPPPERTALSWRWRYSKVSD
jgi:hypothetical protein